MKRNIYRSRGFTLIELLVVITIIGLLSAMILIGLSGVRSQGRDTRRISDLRQMQNGLELYFNTNQTYPVTAGGSPASRWQDLTNALVGANLGITIVARDPLNRDPYLYDYMASSDGLHYVLKTVLENSNNAALRDSVRGIVYGIDCGSAGSPYYCISL